MAEEEAQEPGPGRGADGSDGEETEVGNYDQAGARQVLLLKHFIHCIDVLLAIYNQSACVHVVAVLTSKQGVFISLDQFLDVPEVSDDWSVGCLRSNTLIDFQLGSNVGR